MANLNDGMIKGKDLAAQPGIDCKQALYSAWGNFYAAIKDFPCALFDENGFIVIHSADDLEPCGIKVNKRTNIPQRIVNLPRYRRFSSGRESKSEGPQTEVGADRFFEGASVTLEIDRYERDRLGRAACISHYGCKCHACGITLSNIYGPVADGLIEVHHLTPIASIKCQYELDPIRDLRPICPNCHAVAHLRSPPFSLEEIRTMLARSLRNS